MSTASFAEPVPEASTGPSSRGPRCGPSNPPSPRPVGLSRRDRLPGRARRLDLRLRDDRRASRGPRPDGPDRLARPARATRSSGSSSTASVARRRRPGRGRAVVTRAHRPDRRLAADPRAMGRRHRDRAADGTDPRPRGGRDRRRDRGRDRAGRRPPGPGRLQPGPARRDRRGRLDLPRAAAGSGGVGRSGSWPTPARSCPPSPTRPSAAAAPAPARRASTAGRWSGGCRAHRGCSSAPATAPGGSRPVRPPRA